MTWSADLTAPPIVPRPPRVRRSRPTLRATNLRRRARNTEPGTSAAEDRLPEQPPPRRGALVVAGKVPGRLKSWIRAVDGRWIGVVDFASVTSKPRSSSTPAASRSPPMR
jgi:hypothetical protein